MNKEAMEIYCSSVDGSEFVRRVTDGMYHDLYRSLLRYAALSLRAVDEDLRNDLVQTAFMQFVRKPPDLTKGTLLGWFHKVLDHELVNYLRKRLTPDGLPRLAELDAFPEYPPQPHYSSAPPNANPEKWLNFQRALDDFEDTLNTMHEKMREAVVLQVMDGYTAKQAAAETGLSVSTVTHYKKEGLRKLRAALQKYMPPERSEAHG
jgi:RNA polymerase sigma factor (sigma-70 family)